MTLAPGTKAVIKPRAHGNHFTDKAFVEKWENFPVEIIHFDPRRNLHKNGAYYCKPLRERPDMTNDPFYQFYWDVDEVEADGPKDSQGRTIQAGDKIVYPVRTGSSMWMVTAKVLEAGAVTEDRWNWQTKQKEPYERPFLKVEAEGTKFKYDHVTKTGEHVSYTYRRQINVVSRVTVVA